MKLLVASAALCFLMGAPAFAHPQQEPQQQQDEKAKKQQEEKQRQAPDQKEEKRQEEPARQQNDRAKQEDRTRQDRQQQETSKQQEKQQKEMEKQQKEMEKQQKDVEKQQRKTQEQQSRQEEPRTGGQERAERAEGGETHHGGRHIPDERFHSEFGREHHFHVGIHRGERRFVYGGYAFAYVDAWPADWGYDDDFYIDFIGDDYYLCDVEHPEIRLLVIVND
jgi:hypothetical protein